MIRVWINKATRRYYRVHLQPDLFDAMTLIRCWGSLDTQRGRVRNDVIQSWAHGLKLIEEIDKLRRSHGYIVATGYTRWGIEV